MASNKLEKNGINARNTLITINDYDNVTNNNNYTSTHTKALSDNKTPEHGKGNPKDSSVDVGALGNGFYDINGAIGNSYDINGSPQIAGSGRIANVLKNPYNFNLQYIKPDTTLNVGKVKF